MPKPKDFIKSCSAIIITGGSSGIGTALIKTIRSLDPDVLICNLSRSAPADFSGNYDRHFACDLTDGTALQEVTSSVAEVISKTGGDGQIVLINNSGFGDYGVFQELETERQLKMIDLNVRAMVELTGRFIPMLVRSGGVVVNIASTAAFQPTPILATYGATKAFVLNWTLALGEDLRGSGVKTLAVCPGPTATHFFRNAGFGDARVTGFGQTAEAVAEETIEALSKGRALVVTGWSNKFLSFVAGKLPRVLITRLSAPILRKLRSQVSKVK